MRELCILSALLLTACSAPQDRPKVAAVAADAPTFDAAFWSHWGDGSAELAGYDLTYPRYGELRRGVAVTIFVTEPFSNSLRVKADPGKHPPSDEFPVMKLNLMKDYQTGIYDYNDMLSAFVALAAVNGRPPGSPAKVSFSRQEWCGHFYSQFLFDERAVRGIGHSYFDGEADRQQQLDYPPDGVTADTLLLWARGMTRPVLAPGETRTVPALPALGAVREAHVEPAWTRATLSRSAPSGEAVDILTAQLDGGPKQTFHVEKTGARRILRWESSAGERADFLAAERVKYWQLNGKGGEEALKKLGLSPRPPKTT